MSDHGEWTGTGTVRFVRTLPGPIETVWAFLTESDRRARWLAGGEWDLTPGGRAELIFNNDDLSAPGDWPPQRYEEMSGTQRFDGRILEVDPPRRLVLQWHESGGEFSVVTFLLTPVGERVRLTLTHTCIVGETVQTGAAAGWHTHLDIWSALAAGRPAPSFWRTHTQLEADYARSLRPDGAPA